MTDDEKLKLLGLTPTSYNNIMDSLSRPIPTIPILPDFSAEMKELNEAIIQKKVDDEVEELRRHQELVNETQKQSLILLESNSELTKINEKLKIQIFKLEETIESHSESLKIQDKQLNLLIDTFDKNSDEAKISKRLALVAILISLIPYFKFIILKIKSLMLLK